MRVHAITILADINSAGVKICAGRIRYAGFQLLMNAGVHFAVVNGRIILIIAACIVTAAICSDGDIVCTLPIETRVNRTLVPVIAVVTSRANAAGIEIVLGMSANPRDTDVHRAEKIVITFGIEVATVLSNRSKDAGVIKTGVRRTEVLISTIRRLSAAERILHHVFAVKLLGAVVHRTGIAVGVFIRGKIIVVVSAICNFEATTNCFFRRIHHMRTTTVKTVVLCTLVTIITLRLERAKLETNKHLFFHIGLYCVHGTFRGCGCTFVFIETGTKHNTLARLAFLAEITVVGGRTLF